MTRRPPTTVLLLCGSVLLGFLPLALVACGGSSRSPEEAFAADVGDLCGRYAPQLRALDRKAAGVTKEARRAKRALARQQGGFMDELRQLSPPKSTGVSQRRWRAEIRRQRADAGAVDRFYATWMRKLERSWGRRPNPMPELPPGTGATATILAQAFNSSTGTRFLQEQKKLLARISKDEVAWARIGRATGWVKACASGVPRTTTRGTSTTTTTGK